MGHPINPDLLARRRQLRVLDGGPGCDGLLVGSRIIVDESLRPQRRWFAIAHEIGHDIQRKEGLPDTEHGANYLASALLLPREAFELALRRWGWDLIRLAAHFRYASFEAIARRICALRDARACVFDRPLLQQCEPAEYTIPWRYRRPTLEEREAADAAFECGAPVEFRAGLTAWPVLEHDWHRAITVANL